MVKEKTIRNLHKVLLTSARRRTTGIGLCNAQIRCRRATRGNGVGRKILKAPHCQKLAGVGDAISRTVRVGTRPLRNRRILRNRGIDQLGVAERARISSMLCSK